MSPREFGWDLAAVLTLTVMLYAVAEIAVAAWKDWKRQRSK